MKKIVPNPEMEIEDRINDLQDFEIKVNKKVDQKPAQKIKGSIVEDLEKFEDGIYPQAAGPERQTFFFRGN